jgi:oligoendopeptidase F
MKFALLAATILSLAPGIAEAASAAPPAVWDLTALYPDPAAWEAERKALEPDIAALAKLKGTLGSATGLAHALDQISAVRKSLARLETYAGLAADVDTRVAEAQARRQLATDLETHLEEAISFLRPEIAAIGRAKIEGFVAAEKALAKHRYQIETILRLADHTLGPDGEALLAAAQTPLGQPQEIYELLANADLPYPSIEIRGQSVKLDQQGYVSHRDDADPAIRRQVFDQFWGAFKTYERTFGATYGANVRSTVFYAKARKYPNALASSLSSNNVPESVYRTLIAETHKGLGVLHRYLKAGQTLLGLPELRYSDVYVPFAKPPRSYTLGEAEDLILQGVAPLGPDYAKDLKAGFDGGWMHSLVQPGKRGGAYMNGSAYDVHPFVLLSFADNYASVSTVAHEFGHAMHSVLANRAQPFETADYSIFVAEIPSTTNEMLLADHVIATAKTKAEKIYALSAELELLRGTFFRQAMFAEFEAEAHDAVERGDAVTGEGLTKTYLGLLRQYMGESEGVMKIDDLYGIEWAYIPHFYNDFYVYQYATSISAAAYFADGIERGDTALRQRYFDMLKAGGSDDPYEIVKRAGVDMATPTPYAALVARMGRLVDTLEKTIAEKD